VKPLAWHELDLAEWGRDRTGSEATARTVALTTLVLS
jgi:hypothetical protein